MSCLDKIKERVERQKVRRLERELQRERFFEDTKKNILLKWDEIFRIESEKFRLEIEKLRQNFIKEVRTDLDTTIIRHEDVTPIRVEHHSFDESCDLIIESPSVAPILVTSIIDEKIISEEDIVEIHHESIIQIPRADSIVKIDDIKDENIEVKDGSPNAIVDVTNEESYFVEDNSEKIPATLTELRATHIYIDPFWVHYIPLQFVIADFYGLKSKLKTRMLHVFFKSFVILDVSYYVRILRYVWFKFVFDPGGFEDESFRRGRV